MTEPERILVVDDDDDIRELLQLVLRARGYDVALARDGLDALHHLATHEPPALILLDLMMPQLDGAKLLEALRKDRRLADVPVVILSGDHTACRMPETASAAMCLVKPVDLHELFDVVQRTASHAH